MQCPVGTIYNETLDICVESNNPIDTSIEDNKISIYQELITNGSFNTILDNIIDNNKDYIEQEGLVTFHITSTEIQKISKNNNSIIDLGKCEYILKDIYRLNYSIPLIVFKVEYKSQDTLIPMIEYEIYHPYNHSKLDLSFCSNLSINLNISVSIDENKLYIYDPNSDYYTDDCSTYSTDEGLDIIINDRKKEFIDNKFSLCQINCSYEGYNKESKKSICKCTIKNKMDLISQMINNTYNLSNSLNLDEENLDLLSLLKCAKALFSLDGLIKNISSYVLGFFILFFIISILIFIKSGYLPLISHINKILKNKFHIETQNNNSFQRENTSQNNKKRNNRKFKKKKKNNFPPKKKTIKFSQTLDIENSNNKNSKSVINRQNGELSLNLNNNNKDKSNNKNKRNKNKSQKTKKNKFVNKKSSSLKKNNFKNMMILKKFNDYELNTFDYRKAVLYDKRTFCQYYNSLLKTKHPVLFSFFPIKDYNSQIIKICMFLLSFAFNYGVNFILVYQDIVHKLYENKGKYDILYYLPQIIISFSLSHIITIILKFVFFNRKKYFRSKK